MNKNLKFTLFLLFVFGVCSAQSFNDYRQADSLRNESATSKEDKSRVLIMARLCDVYSNHNIDSAIMYGTRALALAKRIGYLIGEVKCLVSLGNAFETKGDLPKALNEDYQALQLADENHFQFQIATCLCQIGNIFQDLNDNPKAISFYLRANQMITTLKNEDGLEDLQVLNEVNLGETYMQNNQLDSAFLHLQNTYSATLNSDAWHPVLLMFFGDLQFRRGKHQLALGYLHKSIEIFQNKNDHFSTSDACRIIAGFFKEMEETDSCIYYAKEGLSEAQIIGYKLLIIENSKLLAEMYEPKNLNRAYYYLKLYISANDDLYGAKRVQDLQKTLAEEQHRQQQIQEEQFEKESRLKQYGFIAGLVIILMIAFILYRNNLQKKKANILLHHQKEKVETTLSELKSTQKQLIQSEKMASLGELTAGIAHEIQNPLNFVNNFSDVNKELVDELQTELKSGNTEEAISISNDIKENSEKINHHGKRAGDIVKGMLQHSRSSTGVKEPTDINALADEYLRLSYHGLRAKDKDFNATMNTDFDETIGKINIIPQDIGRVLLNLYNNAFYACTERSRSTVNEQKNKNLISYEPTVSVTTKKSENHVIITVSDNGNGIPQKIIDKIFQPFFTTKPTGQGTGLGLSLSYDIIKAHGGEIKVETKEGEGTGFIIQLPVV